MVALAWDSHVHHARMRTSVHRAQPAWVGDVPADGERFRAGASNPVVLPSVIGVEAARTVLTALRAVGDHRFLTDDVSLGDSDVPKMVGYRQVTDAHLLTLARRRGLRVVTFDVGLHALAQGRDVELLTAL